MPVIVPRKLAKSVVPVAESMATPTMQTPNQARIPDQTLCLLIHAIIFTPFQSLRGVPLSGHSPYTGTAVLSAVPLYHGLPQTFSQT